MNLSTRMAQRVPAVLRREARTTADQPTLPMYATRLRRKLGAPFVPLAGFVVAFLVIYSACLMLPYAISDDYPVLAQALKRNFTDYMHLYVLGGRPVIGVWEFIAYSALNGVSDLRYLRFLGIIGIGILAWMLFRALLAAGMERRSALIVPIFICVMPAFEVFAGWALLAPVVYAAIAGGGAFLLAERAVRASTLKPRLILGGASVALVLVGMMIYQPSALMFVVFGAIALFVPDVEVRDLFRRGAMYLGILFAGIVLEYLVLTFLPRLIYGTHGTFARAQLASGVRSRLSWYIHGPLIQALSLTDPVQSVRLAIVVGVVIVAGLLLHFRGTPLERGIKLAAALALIPLAYISNLVIADTTTAFRTQVAAGSLVALYVALAIWSLARRWESGRQFMAPAALLLVTVIAVFSAVGNVVQDLVVPQYVEYQLVSSQLRAADLDQATSVYIIPADSWDGIPASEEFDMPSSSLPWSPSPMVYLALHDINPKYDALPIVVMQPGGATTPPLGSVLVNLQQLRYFSAATP